MSCYVYVQSLMYDSAGGVARRAECEKNVLALTYILFRGAGAPRCANAWHSQSCTPACWNRPLGEKREDLSTHNILTFEQKM